jgi:hypothetical protein
VTEQHFNLQLQIKSPAIGRESMSEPTARAASVKRDYPGGLASPGSGIIFFQKGRDRWIAFARASTPVAGLHHVTRHRDLSPPHQTAREYAAQSAVVVFLGLLHQPFQRLRLCLRTTHAARTVTPSVRRLPLDARKRARSRPDAVVGHFVVT